MVKIQPSFKYSEFHANYFTIFSLITTLQSRYNVKASFELTSPEVMFDANVLSLWSMFKSGSSNISSFSVRHRLQRFEVAL